MAAFTTSLARLKLYEALDFLGDRALYYDTDSVIYKTKPGQEKLPLGPYLGQFTNELGGDTIVEFVSGGAKNYGYLTKKGKTECKISITIPDYFDRDQVTKKIKITKRVKNHGLVFDKRVIDPTTRVSTPYGYSWFGAEVELLLSLQLFSLST